MTFAAPLFLLAAAAAAIPIVLHMINRRKAKPLPFATLRFLKISVEKTRRRKRVHDLLLLATRAALLLLIAIGLARPAVTHLGMLWGASHSAVVIILDNSASMGLIDPDRPRLDTAVAAATQILDQLYDGDEVALLVTCGQPVPAAETLDRTQDAARGVLGRCRVSYERADLDAKLRQAQQLIAKSDAPNKQIYVISDMQRASWDKAEGESNALRSPIGRGARGEGGGDSHTQSERALTLALSQRERGLPASPASRSPSPIPIIVVDCNRKPKPNVAVYGVDLQTAAPVAGLPIKATVTLLNASTVSQQRRVELWIDGAREASSPELSLPPEGKATYDFVFTFKSGGLHRGECRLVGDDGSKYDDRRFFAMQVEQGIPVAIVRAKRHAIAYLDDAYYLEQAFAPGATSGAPVQTTMLLAGDLLSEPLEKYKLIFCVNLPALGPEAAQRLRAYVAGGGNVLWICGDNVSPEAYNQMNEQARGQLLPGPLVDVRSPLPQSHRDSWHVSFLDKTFPPFRGLVEPASLYDSVLVSKHVRMAIGEAGRVLARLDDGEPLLAMRDIDHGKVLLLGVSVHVNWSNLPLRPIFLPLLTRLTFELAKAAPAAHNALAGQPLVIDLPSQLRSAGIEVVPPSGETLRLKTEGSEGKPGQVFRYGNTHDIGIYQLRPLGVGQSAPIAYAVNSDPDEADPAKIDRAELEKLAAGAPLVFAENPDDLSGTFTLLREGKSLWGPLLALVLVGLVFETFLSNQFGPKRDRSTK